MGNILFPQHFCPMAAVGVNGAAVIKNDAFDVFQCVHCTLFLGEVLPTLMSKTPMIIQNSSLTRVIRLVKTPNALGMDNPPVERAKPPSRVPICMGEKKKMLANKDVNATIRMLSANAVF